MAKRYLVERIGRRGAFLLFLTLLDVLYGVSILQVPGALSRLHLVLSATGWGWWWIGTGVICCPAAFVRRDRLAFSLAAFLKAAWAGAWVDVWISDDFVPRAWVSVVIWLAFAMIVLVVSSWPEVRSPHQKGDDCG